jgi:hypothetical protein
MYQNVWQSILTKLNGLGESAVPVSFSKEDTFFEHNALHFRQKRIRTELPDQQAKYGK